MIPTIRQQPPQVRRAGISGGYLLIALFLLFLLAALEPLLCIVHCEMGDIAPASFMIGGGPEADAPLTILHHPASLPKPAADRLARTNGMRASSRPEGLASSDNDPPVLTPPPFHTMLVPVVAEVFPLLRIWPLPMPARLAPPPVFLHALFRPPISSRV
jgi:hypothetical protein